MPIYEYCCSRCQHGFTALVGVGADAEAPSCPGCGSHALVKLISRVARIRSKTAVMEELADPSKIGDLEDPKSMAKWMKTMGGALADETGEDLSGEMDQIMEEASQDAGGTDSDD